MRKWQREVIRKFEAISTFDFVGKDKIKSDADFWDKWDWNFGWLSNMIADVDNMISPYSHLRLG